MLLGDGLFLWTELYFFCWCAQRNQLVLFIAVLFGHQMTVWTTSAVSFAWSSSQSISEAADSGWLRSRPLGRNASGPLWRKGPHNYLYSCHFRWEWPSERCCWCCFVPLVVLDYKNSENMMTILQMTILRQAQQTGLSYFLLLPEGNFVRFCAQE